MVKKATKFLYRCYLALVESFKSTGAMDPTFGAFCLLTLTVYSVVMAILMIVGYLSGAQFDPTNIGVVALMLVIAAVLAISIYRHRSEVKEFEEVRNRWSSRRPFLICVVVLFMGIAVTMMIAYFERSW